jgi:3-hydroxyisobutyrate dehydrogenase-like beta-hydroxyacid dehydrogenase
MEDYSIGYFEDGFYRSGEVVISMVWDIPQTEEVIFGKDGVICQSQGARG